MPKPPQLLPQKIISVKIERDILLSLYEKHDYLPYKEIRFARKKKKEVEQAINQLKHCLSVIEQILLKETRSPSSFSPY